MKKIFFTFILLFLLMPVSNVFAADVDFKIVPNIKSHLQISGEGYINYDVEGLEGKTITESFTVENFKNEKLILKVTPRNVLTSMNGATYDSKIKNNFSGLTDSKYDINNFIKELPIQIELEPNEVKTIDYTIDVPKDIKGKVVGGIGLTDVNPKKEDNEGISIDVKSGYVFSIWLSGESLGELNDVIVESFTYEADGQSPVLFVELINNNRDFLKKQNVDYKVVDRSSGDVVFENSETIKVISPNNFINYKINWDGTVKNGEYELIINEKTFDFEITKEDAKIIAEKQENDSNIVETTAIPIWMWVVLVLFGMTTSGFIVFFLIKRKKDKVENDVNEEDNTDESA